jgi:hypothetical protein
MMSPSQPKTMRDMWGHVIGAQPSAKEPTHPDLAVVTVEVLDVDAARGLDVLLKDGDRMYLEGIKERTVLSHGGREAIAVTPTERGAAKNPTWATVQGVYAVLGKPRPAREREDHIEAARAWATAAHREPPTDALDTWEGRAAHAARALMIADKCAGSFLVPASVAA